MNGSIWWGEKGAKQSLFRKILKKQEIFSTSLKEISTGQPQCGWVPLFTDFSSNWPLGMDG